MTVRQLASILVLSLSGCGGTGPVALDDFEEKTATAICDRIVRCCGEDDEGFPPRDECVANRIGAGTLTAAEGAVNAGLAEYDGEAAASCVSALGDADCGEGAEPNVGAIASCGRVFSGTLEDGATCTTGTECVSQNCERDASTDESRCAQVPGLGEPCVGVCAEGLACVDLDPAPPQQPVCSQLPVLGEPCPANRCATGLGCEGDEEPTCVTLAPTGDACEENDACESGNCVEGMCAAPRCGG